MVGQVQVHRKKTTGFKSRIAAGLAGAALLVGVPSASFAVGLMSDGESIESIRRFVSFTPAAADPDMARLIEARGSMIRMKRFTPAGATGAADRSVTVAVRVNTEAAQAISVHNAIASVAAEPALVPSSSIATSRYNLGVARGYQRFAQPSVLSQSLSSAAIPDLSQFETTNPAARDEPSRFAARVALEEEGRAAPAAPQTYESIRDQRLDVAGSYRLSRNIDVTAGIRYEQERNRRLPLPDIEQQDSQAVYIGTQFRF